QALRRNSAGHQAQGQTTGTDKYFLHLHIVFLQNRLEAYAKADSGEVAINQGVVLAIKEVGVTDAGTVPVGVISVQTDTDRLGVFVEVGAVTLNVMRPGDIRAQVDTGNHVAVVQGCTQAVTPGEVSVESLVFTPAVAIRVVGVL